MATTNAMSPSGVYTDWNTGPEASPYIKRSKYLAAALQGMQESGKNIQSAPELGLKLLSQAVLAYGDKKNDEKLKGAQQKDIGNEMSAMLTSLGGGASPAAPEAAPSPQMAMGDSTIAPAPKSAPIESSPLPSLTPPKSSRDLDLLARTLIGEAGNQGPQGQQAVAQVIVNRAKQSGQPIADVVLAKGQFEPWNNPAKRAQLEAIDTNSPQYRQAYTNAQAVLDGSAQLPPAVAGADHFYSPKAQAALGRQPPSWDNGSGTDMGGHRFFGLGYGGQPPVTPGAPQGMPQAPQGPPPSPMQPQMAQAQPQLSMPELSGPQGGAQPFQIAQNGGLPPMPSSAMGGAPPAPQAPQGGHGATPQEIQLIQGLMQSGNPQKVEAARAMALKIQQRIAAPPEYEVRIDPNTQQAYYAPRDPHDGAPITTNIPGARGQLQQGWRYDETTGRAKPIEGTESRPLTDPAERVRYGIQPTDHSGYTISPTNQITKAADSPYGADRIQAIRQDIEKAPEITAWSVVAPVWQSMKEAVNHPNRAGDLNLVYGVAKLMDPGSVVREGEQVLVNNTNSLPDWLTGQINRLNGGAALQPDTRAALMTEAQSRAQAAYQNAQPKLSFYKDFAARNQIDSRDIIPNLPAFEPYVPHATSPHGSNALSGNGPPAGNSGVGSVSARPQPGQAPVQAPDGNYYVADPKRPGKYLRVVQ